MLTAFPLSFCTRKQVPSFRIQSPMLASSIQWMLHLKPTGLELWDLLQHGEGLRLEGGRLNARLRPEHRSLKQAITSNPLGSLAQSHTLSSHLTTRHPRSSAACATTWLRRLCCTGRSMNRTESNTSFLPGLVIAVRSVELHSATFFTRPRAVCKIPENRF